MQTKNRFGISDLDFIYNLNFIKIRQWEVLFGRKLHVRPNSYNFQKHQKKKFDQGVHDHDVLVDLVHILEGGKKLNFIKIQLLKIIFAISIVENPYVQNFMNIRQR